MAKTIAIIGSGPAALMAASVLAAHGHAPAIFEKNKGPGHKLLIAGGSGLNISNELPLNEFIAAYSGAGIRWIELFGKFSATDWLDFIHKLGLETFAGTSGRYFVREMKASGLLRSWLAELERQNVNFTYSRECVGFDRNAGQIKLFFADGSEFACAAVLFALGGGSWLKEEALWPRIFRAHHITVNPFIPSNAGFQVAWHEKFIAEAENRPLKNIEFISGLGRKRGDLMITRYGIEGTPVYTLGRSETCFIDLKPDLSEAELLEKLDRVPENLSPLRRAKRNLNLADTALALLYHEAPAGALESTAALARTMKNFPLQLGSRQPLSEAISSAGGLDLAELDGDFMLKKIPGVFAAGEMLDWDAPTGGFLIQACVSQGFAAAHGILKYLRA